MPPERSSFYHRTLERLVSDGVISRDSKVLVVCGDRLDRDVFSHLGFSNVTISNVDESLGADSLPPFRWSFADAEDLPFEDEEFDWGVVSAGLHHCHSPHRALLELYRVSRLGVVGFESRDSAAMRIALRAGLTSPYELVAVAGNGMLAGGVANSAVPNYVYRWTEREVEKTVASFAPHRRHAYLYARELEIPWSVIRARGWKASLLKVLTPVARLLADALPSQSNLFAFTVMKVQGPDALQPWVRATPDGPAPDAEWIRRHI